MYKLLKYKFIFSENEISAASVYEFNESLSALFLFLPGN